MGLALEPDLVTVVSGVNDVVRPSVDLEGVASDLEAMYSAFSATGAVVMGCTFPLPEVGLTRRIAPRLSQLNAHIRVAAERHGVVLVELADVPVASDLRLWNADRIHLNPEGHTRLAKAFWVNLLGQPSDRWTEPLPNASEPGPISMFIRETAWVVRFLLPKISRMVRGKSSGDGCVAKRPELRPVTDPS